MIPSVLNMGNNRHADVARSDSWYLGRHRGKPVTFELVMDIASPAALQKALNTEKECTLTLRRDLVPPWIDIQGLPREGLTRSLKEK
jgi:hypothetical protein